MRDHSTFSTPTILYRRSHSRGPILLWTLLILILGVALGWVARGLGVAPPAIIEMLPHPISMPAPQSLDLTPVPALDGADQAEFDSLKEERDRMRQRIVALERTEQIDKTALQELKNQIADFQGERLRLEEELTMLRGVVDQDELEGLRLRNFRIVGTTTDSVYKYQFTVTQSLQGNEQVSGSITIRLEGSKDNKKASLEMAELSDDQSSSLKMRFKHFQDVEGAVKLPEGFEPRNFVVEIRQDAEDGEAPSEPTLAKSYDWVVNS